MTGYSFISRQEEDVIITLEMKGYNSRFLDISVNLSGILSALEPRIREYIAGRFNRGKIETNIRIKEQNAPVSIMLNRAMAQSYYRAIQALADELDLDKKPSLKQILSMEGVLDIEKNRDDERYWKLLEPVLAHASNAFDAERIREGNNTKVDIFKYINSIEKSVQDISALVPIIESTLQENLRSRFYELLGEQIDENRLLAETALLVIKYSIGEELSRLSSHLAAFIAEASSNPSPGKKLDFLCQEINREINTIGSKTPNIDVSRSVVAMKDALENIREQLRNVE